MEISCGKVVKIALHKKREIHIHVHLLCVEMAKTPTFFSPLEYKIHR